MSNKKNSWILSVPNIYANLYTHHYLCHCNAHHIIHTPLSIPYPPDYRCKTCENDYFIEVNEFIHTQQILFWKHFEWDSRYDHHEKHWRVTQYIAYPVFDHESQSIAYEEKDIFAIDLKDREISHLHMDRSSLRYKIMNQHSFDEFKTL